MARHTVPFSQAEVTRAIKGARGAGVTHGRVEIALRDGRTLAVAFDDRPSFGNASAANPWDEVLEEKRK